MKFEVRNSILLRLENNGCFDPSDFNISEGNMGRVIIKYAYSESEYAFGFIPPSKQEKVTNTDRYSKDETVLRYVFKGDMTPGVYTDKEYFEEYSFESVLNRIDKWCSYLKRELFSVHELRKFEELEKMFEEINIKIDQKTEEIEDKYMTKEEAEYVFAKLDELEKSMTLQLEKEIEDKKKLQEEFNNLKVEFTKLKESTKYMKKKSWVKKCLKKLVEWYKNPDKRVLLTNGIKLIGIGSKLLGIEPQIELPREIVELLPSEISNALPENNELDK